MVEIEDQEKYWNAQAKKLINRKIVNARYMTHEEAEELGWHNRPVVLFLDNGEQIVPSSDDEGNDAGAVFLKKSILPVLR